MSERTPSSPSDLPAPSGVIVDREKAEIVAYAGKPYLEMAKLAKENGMGDEEIQSVLELGNKAEDNKEKVVDDGLTKLKRAIDLVATMLGEPSDKAVELLGSPKSETSIRRGEHMIEDRDSYRLAKDRLYKFMGVTNDDYSKWKRSVTEQVSDDGLPTDSRIQIASSPLGIDVIEAIEADWRGNPKPEGLETILVRTTTETGE